jgi:hypothetical protein
MALYGDFPAFDAAGRRNTILCAWAMFQGAEMHV